MSQFPDGSKGRKPPVKGSYIDSEYSPWMKLNERDVASIASNTATATPVLAIASAIESLAVTVDPASSMSAVGIGSLTSTFLLTWLLQTIGFALLKTIACLLRNQGESLFRDAVVWLWKWVISRAWRSFTETFFGWLPFWRRERLFPIRPTDDEEPSPRKRIIDRIIPRRRSK